MRFIFFDGGGVKIPLLYGAAFYFACMRVCFFFFFFLPFIFFTCVTLSLLFFFFIQCGCSQGTQKKKQIVNDFQYYVCMGLWKIFD